MQPKDSFHYNKSGDQSTVITLRETLCGQGPQNISLDTS